MGEGAREFARELLAYPGLDEIQIADKCRPCRDTIRTGMTQLTLSITEMCDLRCRYCIYGAGDNRMRNHSGRSMSLDIAIRAVDYFLDGATRRAAPVISFYGGEPLCRLGLVKDIIGHALQRRGSMQPVFTIATNGVLLGSEISDEDLEWLASRNVIFQVSLDGPKTVHDHNRRTVNGLGSHDIAVRGVERLLERDRGYARNIVFSVTIAPPAGPVEVAEYFADFPPYRRFGIAEMPDVIVNRAEISGGMQYSDAERTAWRETYRDEMETLRADYVRECAAGRRDVLSPVVRSVFDADMQRLYHRPRTPIREGFSFGGCCTPGVRKLHVTADGRYQVCERVDDDLCIGDVARGVVIDEVRELQDMYKNKFTKDCTRCWAVRMCRFCYTILRGASSGAEIDKSLCGAMKAQLDASLRAYVGIVGGGRRTPHFLLRRVGNAGNR